jgi:hypothetical protein
MKKRSNRAGLIPAFQGKPNDAWLIGLVDFIRWTVDYLRRHFEPTDKLQRYGRDAAYRASHPHRKTMVAREKVRTAYQEITAKNPKLTDKQIRAQLLRSSACRDLKKRTFYRRLKEIQNEQAYPSASKNQEARTHLRSALYAAEGLESFPDRSKMIRLIHGLRNQIGMGHKPEFPF